MASSKEYLDFILEQLSELDDISYRAMMGEYIIYYCGKVVGSGKKEVTMKLNHITIQTEAFEKEVDFYQKYVGLTIRRDMRHMGRNMVFLSNEVGDTEIEIIENPEVNNAGSENLSVGFHADDLDALHEVLSGDGFFPTSFVSPMPQVRFFFVKDPAGVNVQFI